MYRITLNRVHDTVLINEGADKLKLDVDGDPMRMVAGLSQAQKPHHPCKRPPAWAKSVRRKTKYRSGPLFPVPTGDFPQENYN